MEQVQKEFKVQYYEFLKQHIQTLLVDEQVSPMYIERELDFLEAVANEICIRKQECTYEEE